MSVLAGAVVARSAAVVRLRPPGDLGGDRAGLGLGDGAVLDQLAEHRVKNVSPAVMQVADETIVDSDGLRLRDRALGDQRLERARATAWPGRAGHDSG